MAWLPPPGRNSPLLILRFGLDRTRNPHYKERTVRRESTMLGMVRGLVKDNILIPSFACQKLVLVPSRTMRVRPARRGPQSVEQTADQLSHVIGQNSVVFETPSVKGHIDLRGQAHFDKATRWRIPTPDVQI